MTTAPEHADPERYAELTGFPGPWRDLFWNRDFLERAGGSGAGWGMNMFISERTADHLRDERVHPQRVPNLLWR
jgi:hypothetical protein